MDYYIAVPVQRIAEAPVLAQALQSAYDAGAAGWFQVIDVSESHQLVQFDRSSAEDVEYIAHRVDAFNEDVGRATAEQLTSKLEDATELQLIAPIIDALKSGRCKVFEFGTADLEGLREIVAEPA